MAERLECMYLLEKLAPKVALGNPNQIITGYHEKSEPGWSL